MQNGGRRYDKAFDQVLCRRVVFGSASALAANQVACGQDNTAQNQPPSSITATFNKIPDQLYVGGLFLVTVTVKDEAGHPLPGAHIVIPVDPKYIGRFRKATLRDAARGYRFRNQW